MGIEKEEENDPKETTYLQRLDLVTCESQSKESGWESTIVLKSVRLLKPTKKKNLIKNNCVADYKCVSDIDLDHSPSVQSCVILLTKETGEPLKVDGHDLSDKKSLNWHKSLYW